MSTPIPLKHLEFFTKIVDCGGLLEAATQLNVSPSTASKSLATMEDTLDTTLIKHTTCSATLTGAGQYPFNRTNRLLREFDETLNATSGYCHNPQGELRVTRSIAFDYSRLVNLVDKYRPQFPDVNLCVDFSDNFVNLNETDLDIALRISTAPPQNYAVRKLVPVRWAYCTSPGYLAKKGMSQHRNDLVDHDCLVYPGFTPVLRVADEQDRLHQLKPHMPIQASSSPVLLKSVLEDQGVTYLPTCLIGDHIQKEEIAPLMLDGTVTCEAHALYALYFPSKYSNPKVQSSIGFLMAELNPLPAQDNWIPK